MNEGIRLDGLTVGFAMCGSYCTFAAAFEALENLKATGCDIIPIMSENSYSTDTRFGTAKEHIERFEKTCGKSVIHTIAGAEPIGPKKLLDALVIAPCTGNTLAKLACGVTDTPVTMAAKAHLRNKRPVIVAISTNDGLSANFKNIGALMNTKNVYLVPFKQDDPTSKESSLLSDMMQIPEVIVAAISGSQLQPVVL